MMWNKIERLTFDTMAAAATASAAAGEMVNASTSATLVADCEQVGVSPTAGSVASEGGAFLDMTDV